MFQVSTLKALQWTEELEIGLEIGARQLYYQRERGNCGEIITANVGFLAISGGVISYLSNVKRRQASRIFHADRYICMSLAEVSVGK